MKKLLLFSVCLSVLSIFTACKDKEVCESIDNPTCQETPPMDEECLAHFNTWFYDSDTNTCEQIAYSGCNAKGFETKAACESCKCN